ncbi:MAG TPA: hypothetical protein VFY06_08380 [Verrucomicrobiae bacterium]|nr:hypothetical protein [Verrucomicrobiae bacterium]
MTACIFNGCGVQSQHNDTSDYELNAASFDVKHLKLVESETGIVLPPDSQGQNFLWRGRQIDPSFLAKIAITNKSVNAFTNQVGRLPNQEINVNAPTTAGVAWWHPSKGTIAVEKTYIRKACYVHVIVCQENQVWVLYVEWIST